MNDPETMAELVEWFYEQLGTAVGDLGEILSATVTVEFRPECRRYLYRVRADVKFGVATMTFGERTAIDWVDLDSAVAPERLVFVRVKGAMVRVANSVGRSAKADSELLG